jgi:hypothetical protein
MKTIIKFLISLISNCILFFHSSSTEQFNKAISNPALFVELVLAWLFIAGLIMIAVVIMTHVNLEICKLL